MKMNRMKRPNQACRRPNKFLFLNGGNVSVVNITKSKSVVKLKSTGVDDDQEIGEMLVEVEDSNIHDRHRGAAIVLRVCLEKLIWIRTLGRQSSDATVNLTVLQDLKNYLTSNSSSQQTLTDAERAFNFILDLGDTAAHYKLRDPSRVILPTTASVDMAIGHFDRLSEIVYRWGP